MKFFSKINPSNWCWFFYFIFVFISFTHFINFERSRKRFSTKGRI